MEPAQVLVQSLALAAAVFSCSMECSWAHSWVACSDYRGDVNYFQQDKCYGWPRNVLTNGLPNAAEFENGYQISSPEGRGAAGANGCDVPMPHPWSSGYSERVPFAIYEPGKVYCLAWPMKNHGWLPEGVACHPHSKSDAGVNDYLSLYVSSTDPPSDPAHAQFQERNINELAGLARNCNPRYANSSEKTDACQLGLEMHQNFARDCKGFLRAPKFCENSGMSMGTGCFKVPNDFQPGHYIGYWLWKSDFLRPSKLGGLEHIEYKSCFDFQVVALGSSEARAGPTGTSGVPDSPGLACTNNVEKFQPPTSIDQPSEEETLAPTPWPTRTPTRDGDHCVAPYGSCATPEWGPLCCQAGYACHYHGGTGYARCNLVHAGKTTALGTTSTSTTTPRPSICTGPEQICAEPGWGPTCCTDGYACRYHLNTGYARCRPNAGLIQAHRQQSPSSASVGAHMRPFRRRHALFPNIPRAAPGSAHAKRGQQEVAHAFLSRAPAFIQRPIKTVGTLSTRELSRGLDL